ncbi:hypothetical protein HPP92_011805 [Vanilla planifolia]|uniref:Uncharacterized protein n=1 Tax=Vanilla planifolia TaxID=51239 RepID=A0A835R6R2_VANPL|nr:hypothetical protein HPP92_011805 [Vanilla planifolia]
MQQSAHTSRLHSTPEVLYSKALQSWIFPQYSLPTSIITAMTLSSSKGEADFLHRRQQDWEDSFRNLYYMLRKNICNLFYVCTSQFIALFISGKFSIGKQSCNAYISQSTHGLRDLLQKHDACFSMPFASLKCKMLMRQILLNSQKSRNKTWGWPFMKMLYMVWTIVLNLCWHSLEMTMFIVCMTFY